MSFPRDTIILDRLHITGPLIDDTPSCVIFQVLQANGFTADPKFLNNEDYLKNAIRAIQSQTQISVPISNPTPEQNAYIARFVNGSGKFQWRIESLMKAFNHLLLYYDCEKPPLPNGEFYAGYKDMTYPMAFDSCMLYRICKYNGIKTCRTMTIEEMAYTVRMLTQNSDSLRSRIMDMIRLMPQSQLISVSLAKEFKIDASPISHLNLEDRFIPFHESCSEKKHIPSMKIGSIDSTTLSNTYIKLNDINRILPRISPINHEEAIILGATVYGINLMDCINPCAEYLELQRVSVFSSENRYVPTYDQQFRLKYLCNPVWYDVRKTWEPRLPNIYNQSQVESFAKAEGFVEENDGDSYLSYLQMSRVTPTFYVGVHPSLIHPPEEKSEPLQTVIYREDPLTYGQSRILSFGTVESKTFDLYTIQELIECFRHELSFKNPTRPQEEFPISAIRKLKIVCNEFVSVHEDVNSENQLRSQVMDLINQLAGIRPTSHLNVCQTTEIALEYKELYNIIQQIEKRNLSTTAQSRRLKDYYNSVSNPQYKPQISAYLTSILHLGFYMRGWMVRKSDPKIPIDTIPLNSMTTLYDQEYHGQVMLNVSNAITNLMLALERISPEIREFIRKLPLMKYHRSFVNVDNSFVLSNDPEDGYTILDRVQICREGQSIYSCIRTSSNHFLSSAYYYMTSVGIDPTFNISDVSYIS